MAKTMWVHWHSGHPMTTADAAERSLIERDDGQVENAGWTARNAALALGRLVETLHEKGLLTTDEVQRVLDLYEYEAVTEDGK